MVFEPPGTLNRIHRIHRIHRKRNIRCGTDPGFPTPGVRMTVVYTNSLKLFATSRKQLDLYLIMKMLIPTLIQSENAHSAKFP